jgi:hypothetical protein
VRLIRVRSSPGSSFGEGDCHHPEWRHPLFTQMEEVSLGQQPSLSRPSSSRNRDASTRPRPPVPVLSSDSFSPSSPNDQSCARAAAPSDRLGRIHNRCRLFPRHPARPRTGHSEDARAGRSRTVAVALACPTPGFLQILPLVQ